MWGALATRPPGGWLGDECWRWIVVVVVVVGVVVVVVVVIIMIIITITSTCGVEQGAAEVQPFLDVRGDGGALGEVTWALPK
jgi:hypothetical protein